MSITLEQASKQNRLALRGTCGALASGTRVTLVGTNGVVHDVEARVHDVKHNSDGHEFSRVKRWHHELVRSEDLVILRRRVRLSIF